MQKPTRSQPERITEIDKRKNEKNLNRIQIKNKAKKR